jgi:hypothetical protein
MVFASASWHWIDPAVRYQRAGDRLRANGILAIVTGKHAFREEKDPFYAELQNCYVEIGESVKTWTTLASAEIPDFRDDIEASGLFEVVEVRRYLAATPYTAEGYIDLLNTFSDHRKMEPARRERLYGEVERLISLSPTGTVTRHQLTILNVARLLDKLGP